MNIEKNSKQQFESLGLNTPAARKLADELQIDVNDEIHDAVLSAFRKVVQCLNAQGHRLTPYGEIRAGEISFRDEQIDGECCLRLGCDVVISAGYAHTMTVEEIDAEIAKGSG
jgi:hypothetical protein